MEVLITQSTTNQCSKNPVPTCFPSCNVDQYPVTLFDMTAQLLQIQHGTFHIVDRKTSWLLCFHPSKVTQSTGLLTVEILS